MEFLKASYQDTKFILISLQQLAWVEIMFVLFWNLKDTVLERLLCNSYPKRGYIIRRAIHRICKYFGKPSNIFIHTSVVTSRSTAISMVTCESMSQLWLQNAVSDSGIFKLLNYIRYSSFIALYPWWYR